jgi:radical SAM superfamily enzyme YgiQ (UPF0313 family)
MRLGADVARQVRNLNPDAHICFYGLYAWLNADFLLNSQNGENALADSVLSGEIEEAMGELVTALQSRSGIAGIYGVKTQETLIKPVMDRVTFPIPDRKSLPPLEKYAKFSANGTQELAGYTETTRGCLHTCTHCPVVPVYNGRFFAVPVDIILDDIRNQVKLGARHITFGDPDFLNGPGHSLKIAHALDHEFPGLTFNFTAKVEHIIEKPEVIQELSSLGAAFMVSAFESINDRVLERLQKGHSAADLDIALEILKEATLPIEPTWVPFTPWSTLEGYLKLLTWIEERDLVANIPAVQLSIRLLVPPKSRLLDEPDASKWLGELDKSNFTYQWRHSDPRMDDLHEQVNGLAEEFGWSNEIAFNAIKRKAYELAGHAIPGNRVWHGEKPRPPRLTEDWFC